MTYEGVVSSRRLGRACTKSVAREFAKRGIDGARVRADGRGRRPRRILRRRHGGGPCDLLVTVAGAACRGFTTTAFRSTSTGSCAWTARRVRWSASPEIYAPGDAGDFPLKDGFLALSQADAAADHIAAVVKGRRGFKRPFEPVTVQIVDMLDTAAFVRGAARADRRPGPSRAPPSDAGADYSCGVSPLWRASKRMSSSYLLMQFAAGEPFQTGPGWRLMDVGVRAMSGMLAE